jgi:hypothetical protein
MTSQSSAAQPSDQVFGKVEINVKRALKPVAAPAAFRERLRDGLVMAAQHQQTHQALDDWQPPSSNAAWLWFVGAVMLGVGLSFIVMRLRAR